MRYARLIAGCRLFLAGYAVLTAAFGLAGCAKKTARQDRVLLTLACWEGPEGMESLTRMLNRYKAQHPNVDIEVQQVPGTQYYQRLKIQFAGGVAPDIMQLAYDQLPTFADRKTLHPLNALIERDKFPVDEMFPQLLPALKYKGEFYGLPRGWTTFCLYYNKDMFRKAGVPFPREGWTWDDFLDACQKMTKDTNGDGRIDQFGCDAPTQMDGIMYWIWQNGGRAFTPDTKKCLLDSPEAIEAVQFLQDCQYKYKVFPSPDQAQDLGGGSDMFRNGRQAMFIQGRWGSLFFRTAKGMDGKPLDWDVGPVPMRKQKATVLFANTYVLRRDGPNLEEAWKLMQFLTGPEGQRHQARTGRDMPSFVSVANSPDFLDPNYPPDNDRQFLTAAEYARPLELNPNSSAISELIRAEIVQMFTAKKDVAQTLRSAAKRIDKLQETGL